MTQFLDLAHSGLDTEPSIRRKNTIMEYRTMVAALTLALLVACVEAPTAEQPANSTVTAPSSTAAADQDKPVCEAEEITGSRIKNIVCRTPRQAQWEHDDAQEALQRGTHLPTGGPAGH
jgi:hypothetical protein